MTTEAIVNAQGSTLERKIFENVVSSVRDDQILLNLITDVSGQFNPGEKSFTIYEAQFSEGIEDTKEDGNRQSVSNNPVSGQTIPCDQDKTLSHDEYYRGRYLNALDASSIFFQAAPVELALQMENYVAGLMRAGADTSIELLDGTGTAEGDEIGEKTLEELAIQMDEQRLPKQGRRLLVNSRQYHALIRNFDLTKVDVAGSPDQLRNAFLGRIYGFDVYEAPTNVLPIADTSQAMAFVANAAWWGQGVLPETKLIDQPDYSRMFMSVRHRFGAKVNTFPNAYGDAVSRVYLLGKNTSI